MRLNRILYNENNEEVLHEEKEVPDGSIIAQSFSSGAKRVAILLDSGVEIVWSRTP